MKRGLLMRTTKALLILFGLLAAGCTHTINLRSSHFAVPVVSEKQWSGYFEGVGTAVTKVTLVNDLTTNPPDRTDVKINADVDAADIFMVNNISVDAGVSIFPALELYFGGALTGLRWQFLNPGASVGTWVAALQGSYGSSNVSTTNGDAEAKSKVNTTQGGLSIGYITAQVVPYFSYIYENHSVTTDVTNTSGSFGPYSDSGLHKYYSLGISSYQRGFSYALEYSLIDISWDRSEHTSQNALGFKLGYAW